MLRVLLGAVVIAFSLGCRVCQTCDQYPAFGGSWQRTNPVSGRVGSIFDPAGAKVGGMAAAESIVSEPWNADTDTTDDATESDSRSLLDDLENSLRKEEALRESNSVVPDPESELPPADSLGT